MTRKRALPLRGLGDVWQLRGVVAAELLVDADAAILMRRRVFLRLAADEVRRVRRRLMSGVRREWPEAADATRRDDVTRSLLTSAVTAAGVDVASTSSSAINRTIHVLFHDVTRTCAGVH